MPNGQATFRPAHPAKTADTELCMEEGMIHPSVPARSMLVTAGRLTKSSPGLNADTS